MADDPNRLLQAADACFAAGDVAAARPLVERVLQQVPGHPQITQFLAAILRRLGDLPAAHRAAAAAYAAAPDDARIVDTLGNVLSDLGRHEAARAAYAHAVSLEPDWREARFHLAQALEELGRWDEARDAFLAIGDAHALAACAALELAAGDPAAAAALADRVLADAPDEPRAVRVRTRAALDRGEPDAAARLHAARAAAPDDRELLLDALDLLADEETEAAVAAAIRADPTWDAGRRRLALHRRERQGRPDWLADHEALVAATPRNAVAWRALVELHGAADDLAAAADAAERAAAATGLVEFAVSAFGFHAGAGQLDRAGELLGQPSIGARVPPLSRAKYLLRRRDPAAAERLLAPLCRPDQDAPEAWALRGVAWQALGDDRFAWLNGQPGLVAPFDLRLSPVTRDAVVAVLRRLHGAAALRLGQSVRGGTQTTGNLFVRVEPAIARLREAILAAVERYRAALPAADPAHPLLRHRDAGWRLSAGWSVRLTGGGFHVSHIHPQGLVSSASYWVMPPADRADPQAGWLELGRPPAYLGLDLPPMRTVEPVPGRLVLFPSTLHHGTRPFAGGERITAAFDVALA